MPESNPVPETPEAKDAPPPILAIVAAGGVGSRMGASFPKQYLSLNGKTMLELSVEALLAEPRISRLVVVISPGDLVGTRLEFKDPRVEIARVGGMTRAMSVKNGLAYLAQGDNAWVLVHDAARPCLRPADLTKLIDTCLAAGKGGLLAIPMSDTLKESKVDGTVKRTVPRAKMWRAQTPQFFPLVKLYDALSNPTDKITDEASAIEEAGESPLLVEGSPTNIKVTSPSDIELAQAILNISAAKAKQQ